MRPILLVLALLPAPALAEVLPEPADRARQREACVAWMLKGAYPSGLQEVSCTSEFGLPSPFLFKCASAQNEGYSSTGQREACALFLARAADATRQGYVRR